MGDGKDIGHRISDPLFIGIRITQIHEFSMNRPYLRKVHAPPVDPPKGIQGYKSGWKSETPGACICMRATTFSRFVYTHTHICTYAYIHIHIYAHVCVYVCVYVSTYIVTFRNKIQRRT